MGASGGDGAPKEEIKRPSDRRLKRGNDGHTGGGSAFTGTVRASVGIGATWTQGALLSHNIHLVPVGGRHNHTIIPSETSVLSPQIRRRNISLDD